MLSYHSRLIHFKVRIGPIRRGWLLTTRVFSSSTPQASLEQTQLESATGFIAVDKPMGWSSHDVVNKVRATLQRAHRKCDTGEVPSSSSSSSSSSSRTPLPHSTPHEQKKRTIKQSKHKRKRWRPRVGHGGTLDPLATGILVLGVGRKACAALAEHLAGPKSYAAAATFGIGTDTLDIEGKIMERCDWRSVDHASLAQSLDQFRGERVLQVPPFFSALRVNGRRLFELARKGETPPLERMEPRPVAIYDLELQHPFLATVDGSSPMEKGDWDKKKNLENERGNRREEKERTEEEEEEEEEGEDREHEEEEKGTMTSGQRADERPRDVEMPLPSFGLRVHCGGGCYIRALVRDIASSLGTVAHLTALRRTQHGPFSLSKEDIDRQGRPHHGATLSDEHNNNTVTEDGIAGKTVDGHIILTPQASAEQILANLVALETQLDDTCTKKKENTGKKRKKKKKKKKKL